MKRNNDCGVRKKITVTVWVGISVLGICGAIIVSLLVYKGRYNVVEMPAFSNSIETPTNHRQYDASIQLYVWNGKLYFYPYGLEARGLSYRELCVVEDNTVKRLGEMDMLYALGEGYAYYSGSINGREWDMLSMNLSTGEEQVLASVKGFSWHDMYYEDTIWYVPAADDLSLYYPLDQGHIGEAMESVESYYVEDKMYTVEDGHILVCYDEVGNRKVVMDSPIVESFSLIPCNRGLLCYRSGECDLLYYIPQETGEIMELFTFEGYVSDSGVAVYGDDVYVSFQRLDYDGGVFPKEFENDTLEGTYRINLLDLSVTKLSDRVYTGLFIFDESGIYACDENCWVYKLDFDGNCVSTILKRGW